MGVRLIRLERSAVGAPKLRFLATPSYSSAEHLAAKFYRGCPLARQQAPVRGLVRTWQLVNGRAPA